MNRIFLLPLVVLVSVAGCGSRGEEVAAASLPQRDLALPSQGPAVEIASPVELGHLRAMQAVHRTGRTLRPAAALRPDPVPTPPVLTVVRETPALAITSPEPVQPTVTAPAAANDRELLPGRTVTVIPASSGPSIGSDGVDELPPAGGRPVIRGGGTCRGRGRGPGIASAPRPDFR